MGMAQILYGGSLRQFGLGSLVDKFAPQCKYGDEAMLAYWQETTGLNRKPSKNVLGVFKAQITPELWATEPRCISYAACDVEASWVLWHVFNEKIKGTPGEKIAKIERELLPSVVRLNQNVLPFSKKRATALIVEKTAEWEKLNEEATKKFGTDVAHPTRLRELAKEAVVQDPTLGEILGTTPTGLIKCAVDSLEAAEQHGWEVAEWVLKQRRLKKRRDTIQQCLDVRTHGGVPATYKPTGAAATGRWSVSNPPLQQIPREAEYRRVFKARKGWKLVVSDYSTMEPRVAATLSRDENLREALLTGDLYSATARQVDGKKKVLPERRQQFKNFFMAYLFGAGPKTLGEQAGMSEDEAKATLIQFNQLFPDYAYWQRELNNGDHIAHTPDGYSLVTDPGFEFRKTAWAVQSSGAYILKRGIIRFRKEYPQYHKFLVGTVHDEVLLHVPEEHAKKAAKTLQKCLEVKGWIDMPAEAVIVDDWSQAK